jgi:hypothetical protein
MQAKQFVDADRVRALLALDIDGVMAHEYPTYVLMVRGLVAAKGAGSTFDETEV